jgi:diguanylate cyclase (GGDEF)-like protein
VSEGTGTETARPEEGFGIGEADRDIVALGIAAAAILMFVGTGGTVLPQVIRSLQGVGLGPDKALVNALLLNIALIIFGWRRYRQLSQEVVERSEAEERARVLAETDPLTGCLNRRSVGSAIDRLIATAAERGEVVAVVMIDLDNFKAINDFNGHSAGDQILVECANRIGAQLPERGVLARLGGDEFACVTAFDPRHKNTVDRLAARIIEAIARPVTCHGIVIDVTVSVGLTRSDARRLDGVGQSDAETLLHMADIAMYHAKKEGRNRYYWFEAPMENELQFRKQLENGIRRGIPAGEFVPFYEQQIDLQTGKLTGFEMLARWNSPELGQVSPDVFIPVAEEIGAIADLSESVIAQALRDARDWDAELSLSVNISPLQLRDPWFAQKLLRMLVAANFPPQRLEIEITESCLHENIGVVRSLLASLKNQGIRVSLDDFGTGYSSLAQLRSLPFDRIKIDRSFVTSLPDNPDSAAIVHAIALLGKGLGLPITVEGIENEDVLALVRQYGDITGQGYLYGRPQPAEATVATIASHKDLTEAAPESIAAPARGKAAA